MKKSNLLSFLVLLVLMPLTLYGGMQLPGRWYYLTCTALVMELMLPFYISFERRKPQAREMSILAVLAALAAASRATFAFLPFFKPITGVIMISGMAFGPQAGFLVGSMGVFASNFLFGQGPWTPWQMLAYGFAGFLGGLLFHKRLDMSKDVWFQSLMLGVFGFFAIVVLVGPMLDCCTLFTTASTLSWHFAGAVFLAGLPVNVVHGLSCGLTLALFTKPLLAKLQRLQRKYGMLDS